MAAAVTFLASRDAAFINATDLKVKLKPAGASAMTWSSTYVLLVLLILPKNNLTCLDWMTGS